MMTPKPWGYVAGGAGNEHTQRANIAAFERWGLYPRMLVAPEERDLSIELFGIRFPPPIFMAPIGVYGPCSQDGHGDLHCAEASARTGVPFFAGTLSADPMEEVAPVPRRHPRFLPALHPTGPGSRREPGAPGRGRGVPGHRRHPRHLGHRVAAP